MKNASINGRCLSSSKRIAPFAYSVAIILAVVGLLIPLRSATTQSKAMRSALNAPAFGSAIPAQSQTGTFYLHGTGPVDNPPTLFLNTTAPTATSAKFKDSAGVTRNGGNLWKEVGTWPAAPAMTAATFASLSDLHVWLGLKNSDDQGTYFDLRVEAYKNSTLVASGQSLCITGVTRNPANAKEVVVAFDPFSAATFDGTSDVLKLKVLTRVGSNSAGGSCGGHNNAVGLRLYFDAVARASRFNATLRSSSDTTPPVLTVTQPADGSITAATQVNVTGTFSDQSPTTITVSGVTATIQGNNFNATVPLTEGQNSLLVTATDAAGNHTEVTRQVVRDTTAPTVAIEQPAANTITNSTQVIVSGTFNDATNTTVQVNNINATLTGNTFSASVPLSEGANVLTVVATDAAGNHGEATRDVNRDTIAPALTITQPADGILTADAQLIVSGTFSDAHTVNIDVAGVEATISGNSYTATVPVTAGPIFIAVHGVDAAGNETTVERSITGVAALSLNVDQPTEGQLTDSPEVKVEGVVSGTGVQLTANGQPLNLACTTCTAFGGYLNLPEGTSTVQIVATDILGRTQTVVKHVTVDTTPPAITGVTPAQDALITETSTTISGTVNDATAVAVKVNDVDASVSPNGVFTLSNFTVSEGANAITVHATDALGNSSFVDVVFQGNDRTAPAAPIMFPIPAETLMQALQVEGRAESGAMVSITGGLEPVTSEAAEGTGLFFATVNLAVGDNALTITNADKDGNVSPASVVNVISNPELTRPPGQPFLINISTNDAQRGLVGQELPRPLIVIVTDSAGEPVAGVPVTFTVSYGGGQLVGGAGQVVATTGNDGRASARYVGIQSGFQYITADFVNNPTRSVAFAAELLNQNPGGETSATGLVLDQNLRALRNVLVRLGGQQTRTGNDGRFKLVNVAFGPHQVLELVGRDQIPFPGRWPNISYDFDVLPGVENHLGRPLFLPRVNDGVQMPLDSSNVITSDTVYELPAVGGLPPIRVTARAGTHVTFPPDVTDKRLSVTRIPVNRTPMILEDGMATNLYISVQPSGAIFDAPLELSFPNLDSLPANSAVQLMSFDHDAGRYVAMGSGHVSADATVVRSDPGSGIRVGAWHALPARPVNIGKEKTKEVIATLTTAPNGNPTFKVSSNNKDVATADFADGFTAQSSPTHIKITGGKKAGTAKIKVEFSDSNNGRAQAVEVAVNVIEVKFEEVSRCSGFDDTEVGTAPNIEPFWLSVVLNGTFTAEQPGGVALARAKITPSNATAAQAVTFEMVDATKATVTPATAATATQQISVGGLAHGETMLRAVVDHEEAGKLGIAVRRRFPLLVAFHFMSDTGGHRQHRVSQGDITAATALANASVAAMNNVLVNQSGIEYIRGNVTFDQVQQDLGPVVSESADTSLVTAFHDAAAAQEIYFVWELEATDTIPVPQPGQTVNRVVAAFIFDHGHNNIVAEDGAVATDLAHEALHAGSVLPTNPYPNDPSHSNVLRELLYPTSNGRGCLIPKRDMDALHNSIP